MLRGVVNIIFVTTNHLHMHSPENIRGKLIYFLTSAKVHRPVWAVCVVIHYIYVQNHWQIGKLLFCDLPQLSRKQVTKVFQYRFLWILAVADGVSVCRGRGARDNWSRGKTIALSKVRDSCKYCVSNFHCCNPLPRTMTLYPPLLSVVGFDV